jgi:hypothetical protein
MEWVTEDLWVDFQHTKDFLFILKVSRMALAPNQPPITRYHRLSSLEKSSQDVKLTTCAFSA